MTTLLERREADAAPTTLRDAPARSPVVERVAFTSVVALALVLNSWGLSGNGLGNTFYAAATWSATRSWHNLFFASFDPGGFITVDKPPVAVWIAGLSARTFGFSGWSILLPSALAGAASVALLWWIVRPRFGVVAASVAAGLLATSPINVAINRLNDPDPFMITFLLGATWAVLRAADDERWVRWAVLAGVLVGLAFNTKMLAAAIPVPALALGLLVTTPGSAWARLRRVVTFGLVAMACCLPWILAVDLVPASSRPFVGGSTNNRVEDLVFGYNGLSRVQGNGQGGAPGGGRFPGGRIGGTFAGPGGVFGGQPGTLRLVNDAVGGQIGWLLPMAIGGGVCAVWCFRRERRLGATVLWVGWFWVTAIVFSYAKGTFHSYYTAALAPAVAVLVGIGVAAVREASRGRRGLVAAVAAGAALVLAATVALQGTLTDRAGSFYDWLRPIALACSVIALGLLLVVAVRRAGRGVVLGALVLGVGAVAITPAAWAFSETSNPTLNATLPQAGPRGGAAAATFGSQAFEADPASLAVYLRAQHRGERWDLVTTTAMNASRLVAEQHVSVMALGGFIGQDPATTPAAIGRLVAAGKVRFFLAGGGFFGGFAGRLPGGFPGSGPTPRVPGGVLPGLPRGGLPRGGLPRGGLPPGGRGPTGGFTRGFPGERGTAGQVMQVAQSVCRRVTDAAVPQQYRSRLYDCAGRGGAFRAVAARASAG